MKVKVQHPQNQCLWRLKKRESLSLSFHHFKKMMNRRSLFRSLQGLWRLKTQYRGQTMPATSFSYRQLSASSRGSSSEHSNPVVQWLISKGVEEKVAIGMIKSFPAPPSISDLQSFGMEGIKALANAVKHEQSKMQVESQKIPIHIHVSKENRTFTLEALPGQTFYELTQDHPRDLGPYLECACRGISACSTCHVYVDDEFTAKLPPPEEDEMDMLDLAWGYDSKRSRLGCQIKIDQSLSGLKVTIPKGVNNLYS